MESFAGLTGATATYLVECFTPGVTRADVIAAAERAGAASAGLSASGTAIEYVGALFMPVDEVVFHMFRSESREAVRDASDRAALGFERVLDSVVINARLKDGRDDGLVFRPEYRPAGSDR